MRFKVGDKVKIKEDLKANESYGNCKFVTSMNEYKGKELTIGRVWDSSYSLKGASFFWTDEMLEPIEEESAIMNIEELNKEYKDKMDALLEEYNQKVGELGETKKAFIEEGQKYFYIDCDFAVEEDCYCKGDGTNNRLLKYGNVYPYTEENREGVRKQVELIAEKRKLQSEMELFARQNNEQEINWNDREQYKWYICLNYDSKSLHITFLIRQQEMNVVYFTSKEIAEKAIDKFGSRIRELYLEAK